MIEKEQAFAGFDRMGEARVAKEELMFDVVERAYAYEWLELRASEARARSEASQAEQMALARAATELARQANQIAATSKTIAIVGSAISIIIAILSWLLPRG